MHILIVEDKENLRQMLTAAVERMGFAVDTAEDGRQAQAEDQTEKVCLDPDRPTFAQGIRAGDLEL